MELSIECQKRETNTNPRALRRTGILPAVLYGHNGSESVSLTVNDREAQRLVRSAVVNKTLINLNVPHLPWSGKVVLREVQRHSWKEELHHLSFFFPGEDFIATSTAETPVEVIAAAEA